MINVYIKIIGSAFIIYAGFLGGQFLSNEAKESLKELRHLKEIFTILIGEIDYNLYTIPEVFKKVGQHREGIYGSWLVAMSEKLDGYRENNIKEVWETSLEEIRDEVAISDKDMSKLFNL